MFKNKTSPYLGAKLRGVVEKTFLRGQVVFDRRETTHSLPFLGELL